MDAFVQLDLHSSEFSAAFEKAPVYRMHSVVIARDAVPGERLPTSNADGSNASVQRRARAGDKVVQAADAEPRLISGQAFSKRFSRNADGSFRPKGRLRVVPNTTGDQVVVEAPWGKEFGSPNCVFASEIDDLGRPTHIRFVVGQLEFEAWELDPDYPQPDLLPVAALTTDVSAAHPSSGSATLLKKMEANRQNGCSL